jgi:hypothetical protein
MGLKCKLGLTLRGASIIKIAVGLACSGRGLGFTDFRTSLRGQESRDLAYEAKE